MFRSCRWPCSLGLAFLLLACSNGPADAEPVRIGVILSLTGDLGSLGDGLTKAVQLAQREANAAGGLLGGRPVDIIVRDDQTDPDVAVAAAHELIEVDGVSGILGAAGSSASLRVAEVTRAARVPQVSCCSTSPALTTAQPDSDRYLFRTVPSDLLQAQVLARQAAGPLACTRLAILHLDNSYGQPLGMAIRSDFEALGGARSVVLDLGFPQGRPDYTDEVQQVADALPDCVALVAYPDSGGYILRDWHALHAHPDVTWIGTDGIRELALATAAGDPGIVDGVLGTAPLSAPPTQAYHDFAASFEASFNASDAVFGANEYDAAMLLMLAIEAAGSTDGPDVRDALLRVARDDSGGDAFINPGHMPEALVRIRQGDDIDYVGASGPVDLQPDGDVLGDYEIWRYDASMEDFVRDGVVSWRDLSR